MSQQPVQRITTARRSHSQDLSARMRTYAISMGIRTACVICIAVVDHWTRWLFVPAAVVLPYVAVLLANAGRERVPRPPATFVQPVAPTRPQIEAPTPADRPA